jgi:hypothetical protein
MEKLNQNRGSQGAKDDLDRALDAALASCLSVEPRPGLEDRVIAQLHAERHVSARRSWGRGWGWGFAAALAVFALLAAMTWKLADARKLSIAGQPPLKVPSPTLGLSDPVKPEASLDSAHDRVSVQRVSGRRGGERLPKLDRFPSLRPLSEQEKILAYYINENPEKAALVAEARMDALRHEVEERNHDAGEPVSRSTRSE